MCCELFSCTHPHVAAVGAYLNFMTCSTRRHTGRGVEQTDVVRRRPFDPRRDVRTPMGYPRDLQRYLHRKWVLQSQTVLALPVSPGIISVGSGRVSVSWGRVIHSVVDGGMSRGGWESGSWVRIHHFRVTVSVSSFGSRRQPTHSRRSFVFIGDFLPNRRVICLSVFLER